MSELILASLYLCNMVDVSSKQIVYPTLLQLAAYYGLTRPPLFWHLSAGSAAQCSRYSIICLEKLGGNWLVGASVLQCLHWLAFAQYPQIFAKSVLMLIEGFVQLQFEY